jgi:hypothetical protein
MMYEMEVLENTLNNYFMTPQKPSFVLGYWRPWNENSSLFNSYLDYVKDTSLVKYGADMVGQYIQSASKEQIEAVNKVGKNICQGLDTLSILTINNTNKTLEAVQSLEQNLKSGFADTVNELKFINRNLDIQIEQQKLSNLLLSNISELLRVPDSEKERQHSIELGIKFFVNAQNNSDLYDDAFEEFKKAESLMKQDYFVLHRIGCIYLYVEKYIDIEKALDYFLRAGKYASIESDPKAFRLANILATNNVADYNPNSLNAIKYLAAESYEKAGFASYILGNFENAIKYQSTAYELNSSAQNQFILAKYLIRNDKLSESIRNLDEAIGKDPIYAVAVFYDIDLLSNDRIISLIETKNHKVEKKIEELLIECNVYSSSKIIELRKKLEGLNEYLFHQKLKELEIINIELKESVNEIKKLQVTFDQHRTELASLNSNNVEQNLLLNNESFDRNNLEQLKAGISLLKANIHKINQFNEQNNALKNDILKKKKIIENIISNFESETEIKDEFVMKYLKDLHSLLNEEPSQTLLDNINKALKRSNDVNKRIIPQSTQENNSSSNNKHSEIKKDHGSNKSSETNKKCFIATAAIGDEDNFIVNDLRIFRDTVLNQYLFGKIFIYFYYLTSPPIALIIRNVGFIRDITAKYFIKPLHSLIRKHIE